jgi:hypothetical protein
MLFGFRFPLALDLSTDLRGEIAIVDPLDHGDLHARTQVSARRVDAMAWDQGGALPRKVRRVDVGDIMPGDINCCLLAEERALTNLKSNVEPGHRPVLLPV